MGRIRSVWWLPAGVTLGILIAAGRGLLSLVVIDPSVRVGYWPEVGGYFAVGPDLTAPLVLASSIVAGVAISIATDQVVRRARPRIAALSSGNRRLVLIIGICAAMGLAGATYHFVDRSYLPIRLAGPVVDLVSCSTPGALPPAQPGAPCVIPHRGFNYRQEPEVFLDPPNIEDLQFGALVGAGVYVALIFGVVSVRVLAPSKVD